MYVNIHIIKDAINTLEAIHPFYGTTFLACKRAQLPVDRLTAIPIIRLQTDFLEEFYKPVSNSDYILRVFRLSDKKYWAESKKYAASTLHAIRTQGVFSDAFLHLSKTDAWGWHKDYVSILKTNLFQNHPPYRNKPVPAFYLAAWLYRQRNWPEKSTAQSVITAFIQEFSITNEEASAIFDLTLPADQQLWQEVPLAWNDLTAIIKTSPPDISPEENGTLAYLNLEGVGPANNLCFKPAERLSLITGDNGLGKTFLLECAWWALTGQWANSNLPAYPRPNAKKPQISFQIAGATGTTEPITISYDFDAADVDKWPTPAKRPTIPGLLIYARVDGSFAVCDPVGKTQTLGVNRVAMPRAFVFTREQVWDGFPEIIQGQKRQRINGLIADWVSWQNDPDQSTFQTFTKVLKRLSPPSRSDLGTLRIGDPVRLPDDTRRIPTLDHPYGRVPVLHAAAGVKRILTIAYLLVWAWNEHKINSEGAHKSPQKRMVVLIDEIEAHLHPQWQRRILPALLEVKEDLAKSSQLDVQSIVATHSPLVLASAEPEFNPEIDKLFHLDIVEHDLFGNEVVLQELPFTHRGLVDYWLTSEAFELKHVRSLEAESAIEAAKKLQVEEHPKQEDIQSVTEDLHKYLSAIDGFWPRWTSFAEEHGVEV